MGGAGAVFHTIPENIGKDKKILSGLNDHCY